jgi:hypothetical protein
MLDSKIPALLSLSLITSPIAAFIAQSLPNTFSASTSEISTHRTSLRKMRYQL